MALARIALVTCADLPNLSEDDAALLPALDAWGLTPDVVVWDDPDVDWAGYDAVIIRSTWDYSNRRDEYVAWAHSVPNLINNPRVVEWNTDKHYLKQLAERDIPVVPTTWLVPAHNLDGQRIHTRLPAMGRYVIKPTVSAGAHDTASFDVNIASQRAEAIKLSRHLVEQGKTVMIQPYLRRIDEEGEICLIFIEGRFSHAVRKEAMLIKSPQERFDGLHKPERISPWTPTEEQLDLAENVIETATKLAHELGISVSEEGAAEEFLYARVDLVPGNEGGYKVIEFEVTEPALFLGEFPEAAARLSDAIARRGIVQAHRASQGLD